MEVIIAGRHMGVRDDLKDYINEKMMALAHDYAKIEKITVTVCASHHEGDTCVVEGHIHGKKLSIDAKVEENDLRTAFDKVYHKLASQLHKYLSKVHDHHHRHGRHPTHEERDKLLGEVWP